ncbi:hypothetical protein scyTo_0000042 [Scyliorhinus torazame]|uniref:Groucho/TLE N-terminal Q-rich domain-containing protein n=1 Tax=Scyliorhinus torazame TaxID=75743 RepID=A0A401NNN3_SCYTO|nr:hypothetical protein [Scyliorhinus torazame]
MGVMTRPRTSPQLHTTVTNALNFALTRDKREGEGKKRGRCIRKPDSRLKLECDKLASEKTEMQRHYVMYYEMSYGLNIEMHKQAEIVKRLNGICAQVIPFLSQEHQQQVVQAIERAKQVTAPELNTVIRQQLQAQQLSHLHGLTVPLTPLPAGLQPPVIPSVSASAGLLALSSALGSQIHLATKDDKNHHDGDHQRDEGGGRAGLIYSTAEQPNMDYLQNNMCP